MAEAQDIDARAMEMIRKSGVLTPDTTLDQLMQLSAELTALEAESGVAARPRRETTFIYKHFIYKETTRRLQEEELAE